MSEKVQRKSGKFGYLKTKQIPRKLLHGSRLFGLAPKSFPTDYNLVIDKPIFLIGGSQEPYDQGNLGSCTANALAFTFTYSAYKTGQTIFMPSRLDAYYQERRHINTVYEDSGANISDCEYTLENVGLLTEKVWPYSDNSSNPTFYTIPNDAKNDVRTKINPNNMYYINNTESDIKTALTNGYPILFGFIGKASEFLSDTVAMTGIATTPVITDEEMNTSPDIFGHAVVCVGYTNDGYYIVRNSWGVNWGLGLINPSNNRYNYDSFGGLMRGYFKMPADYMTGPYVTEAYVVGNILTTKNTILSSTAYSDAPTYLRPLGRTINSPVTIKTVDNMPSIKLYRKYTYPNGFFNVFYEKGNVWTLVTQKNGTVVTILTLRSVNISASDLTIQTTNDAKSIYVTFNSGKRLLQRVTINSNTFVAA